MEEVCFINSDYQSSIWAETETVVSAHFQGSVQINPGRIHYINKVQQRVSVVIDEERIVIGVVHRNITNN